MTDDVEDRLRRTLRAKADQVEPTAGVPPSVRPARRPDRTRVMLAAAAILVLAVAAGVVLAARSGDDPEPAVATDPPPATDPTPTVTAPTTTSRPDPTTTPPEPTTSLPEGLPGTPVEGFPTEGATLAVVGVAADDVLNVRTGPGVEFDVVTALEPLFAEATATGNNRQVDGGAVWAEIAAAGETGWANTAFLLQPGEVTDATASYFPDPADRPSAATMADLAGLVAEAARGDAPRMEVTIVDGPTLGDLAEVTVDLVGAGDDSIGGYRFHLFAERDGRSFRLRTVEQTLLCSRGVSDGVCV